MSKIRAEDLSDDADLRGGPVTDERNALIAGVVDPGISPEAGRTRVRPRRAVELLHLVTAVLEKSGRRTLRGALVVDHPDRDQLHELMHGRR